MPQAQFPLVDRLRFYISWPGLYLYFRTHQHRTRVIVRCKDELLLVRDSTRFFYDDISWTLPGGGIGQDEEDTVAAVRELHEELGIVVKPKTLTHLGERTIKNLGLEYLAQYYLVDIIRKPSLSVDQREISGTGWFTREQIEALPQKPELVIGLELLSSKR